MLKPNKPISTSHEPGLGSSHAPPERGALVNWGVTGRTGRYGDIAAMEKQQSFLNLFIVDLNMFKHVYCFANVCQFWVFQHVESNDLSHKVTWADLWNGKNLTWPTHHSWLKPLVPLK